MMQTFDASLLVLVVLVIWMVITIAMYKKSPLIRMSNIVIGLLMFMVAIFGLLTYIVISLIPAGTVISVGNLPNIIILLVVFVGFVSFIVYDYILKSRLGYTITGFFGTPKKKKSSSSTSSP